MCDRARARSVHSAMLVSLSGGPWPAGPNVLEFGIGSPKFTSLRRHQSQGSLLMLNGRWSTTAAPANTRLTVPGATSCGEDPQTIQHLMHGCRLGPTCTDTDLQEANEAARNWLEWIGDKL
ncbi:hypothetical protein Bbelb_384490 [Branchiostoma belcheri]|nr:hypothetical protein Bbelb_384490 [Branchiostoma belcheri]